MEVIERCFNPDERERYWIEQYRHLGMPLLNIQLGGCDKFDKRPIVQQMQDTLVHLQKHDSDSQNISYLRASIKQTNEKLIALKQKTRRRLRKSRRGRKP